MEHVKKHLEKGFLDACDENNGPVALAFLECKDLLNPNCYDSFGTALMHLYRDNSNNSPTLAEKLLNKGVSANARNGNGVTPLMLLASRTSFLLANFTLLVDKYHADVKAVDDNGYTALHHAAGAGNIAMTRKLLEYGVNPEIRSKRGRTAIDMATEESKTVIQKFVDSKSHEADLKKAVDAAVAAALLGVEISRKELRTKLETTESALAVSEALVDKTKEQCERFKTTVAGLDFRVKELVSEVDKMQARNTELASQVKETQARNTELASQVKDTQARNEDLTASSRVEKNHHGNVVALMSNEIKELKTKHANFASACAAERDISKNVMNNLNKDIDSLNKSIIGLKVIHEVALKVESEKHELQLKELREEVVTAMAAVGYGPVKPVASDTEGVKKYLEARGKTPTYRD